MEHGRLTSAFAFGQGIEHRAFSRDLLSPCVFCPMQDGGVHTARTLRFCGRPTAEVTLHGVAWGMPYALALLNVMRVSDEVSPTMFLAAGHSEGRHRYGGGRPRWVQTWPKRSGFAMTASASKWRYVTKSIT
jgi:hypothetical protein